MSVIKWLFLFVLTINVALAFETHGIGKIAEVQEGKEKRYFLLIKDQDQVGILPIKLNEKMSAKTMSELKEKMVVFRGRILSEKFFTGELEQYTDIIVFSELREFGLKDLRMGQANIDRVEQKLDMKQKPNAASRATVRLDDRVTQAALFTGAGLLVADAAYMNSSSNDTRKDMSKLLIVSAGLVMLAEKIKQRYKIDWGNWDIPMNNKTEK
jgi:hypothetical protein